MNPIASEPLDWLHFVRRSGDEGRRWAEQYRSARELEALSTRSLGCLRRRRFDEGYALLMQLGDEIRSAKVAEPSMRAVLDRWYYGVLGYYFYCLDQSDQAEAAMVQAHQAVAAAIGARRFLLPLANHCNEFRLHRARIARNRARWDEMRTHVDEARGMMTGAVPFCLLEDATPVGIPAIRAFYAAIPSLTAAERDSLAGLLDDAVRLRDFEQFVNAMYRIPGFVIPYP
ncbi:MAG TPA: hypothetical protein VEQ60_08175 [Longimicrobium sp.]|nr:hypothetical protein [Longimicrobium sp.]